jgi:hypothetical protein
MPNHIQNRLHLIGEDSEVEKVMIAIKGKYDDGQEMQIDFNKIKPMPLDLNIESDGFLMPLENSFCVNDSFKNSLDKLREYAEKSPTRADKTIENFIKGVTNYIKYGHATWHGWSCENWGTKWNAYGQSDKRNTNDTIYFQTAWNAPIDLIVALSEAFPTVKFQFDYADEDSSSNTGKLKISKGEITEKHQPPSRSIEAYDIYFELHPEDKERFRLVNGTYEYIDED